MGATAGHDKPPTSGTGPGNWPLTLFASDDPEVIDEVVSGKVQVAIMNPVDPLTLAYRGTGPFNKPLPLRVVTVIPSEDQIAFAVSERTGVTSLDEIRERRVPLRVTSWNTHRQPGFPHVRRRERSAEVRKTAASRATGHSSRSSA